MINMKLKDTNKLVTVEQDQSEIYPEEDLLLEDALCRYLYQPVEQHGDKKRRAIDFIQSKTRYKLD